MRRCLFLLLPLLLVTCTPEPTPSPLPAGEQTVSGIIVSAPFDLLRRGTHILRRNDEDLYFVESTTVNLRAFENKAVELMGFLEANTDPALLPVLIARSVKLTMQETQDVTLSALGLRCTVPATWRKSEQAGVIQFLPEDASAPIVTLRMEKNAPLPSGSPFPVAERTAVRTVHTGTRTETVSLIEGDALLTISFLPDPEQLTDILRSQWSSFLDSLAFIALSSSAVSQTSSVLGTPCGGPAGILCPAGEYCAITDVRENIGHCRKL
ncbi:MAG: hypothetical protein PHS73_04650 [Candidatus Peribacteraceae bacterium]|nr:hypothetical protein [Candidatus Peribacteraceae bacterium]